MLRQIQGAPLHIRPLPLHIRPLCMTFVMGGNSHAGSRHLPLKSRELPLTSDANDILLNSHFILELLVVPKEQYDLAALSGYLSSSTCQDKVEGW